MRDVFPSAIEPERKARENGSPQAGFDETDGAGNVIDLVMDAGPKLEFGESVVDQHPVATALCYRDQLFPNQRRPVDRLSCCQVMIVADDEYVTLGVHRFESDVCLLSADEIHAEVGNSRHDAIQHLASPFIDDLDPD